MRNWIKIPKRNASVAWSLFDTPIKVSERHKVISSITSYSVLSQAIRKIAL